MCDRSRTSLLQFYLGMQAGKYVEVCPGNPLAGLEKSHQGIILPLITTISVCIRPALEFTDPDTRSSTHGPSGGMGPRLPYGVDFHGHLLRH